MPVFLLISPPWLKDPQYCRCCCRVLRSHPVQAYKHDAILPLYCSFVACEELWMVMPYMEVRADDKRPTLRKTCAFKQAIINMDRSWLPCKFFQAARNFMHCCTMFVVSNCVPPAITSCAGLVMSCCASQAPYARCHARHSRSLLEAFLCIPCAHTAALTQRISSSEPCQPMHGATGLSAGAPVAPLGRAFFAPAFFLPPHLLSVSVALCQGGGFHSAPV